MLMDKQMRMQISHGLEGLRQVPLGSVMTVGNFDGVHLGHQRLMSRCKDLLLVAHRWWRLHLSPIHWYA